MAESCPFLTISPSIGGSTLERRFFRGGGFHTEPSANIRNSSVLQVSGESPYIVCVMELTTYAHYTKIPASFPGPPSYQYRDMCRIPVPEGLRRASIYNTRELGFGSQIRIYTKMNIDNCKSYDSSICNNLCTKVSYTCTCRTSGDTWAG